MSTYLSEDHPDRKAEATVPATPVEGLDREPDGNKVQAKVVTASKKAEPKKSSAADTKG
jgi:hypothetical protein